MTYCWETGSPEETQALGKELVGVMGKGGVLLLEGDLGAGKTCLVQGIASALGIEEAVTSPTYSLVKSYGDPVCLVHADLYRLNSEEDLWELGWEEWIEGEGIVAVEWPSRADGLWRSTDWRVRLETVQEDSSQRKITLQRGETL